MPVIIPSRPSLTPPPATLMRRRDAEIRRTQASGRRNALCVRSRSPAGHTVEKLRRVLLVPFVVETSIGVDRMFLQIMAASYAEEEIVSEDGKKDMRVVLRLPAPLAPVKLAVMPLMKKDGLSEKAREIINDLKFDFNCQYDEKDSIGKRYRRQDAIGTPFCVTVDHQTMEDNTVTIRYRDTMLQDRVAITDLKGIIAGEVSMKKLFAKL